MRMSASIPTRRWFRFSLRTMLVLVTVVVLLVGWLANTYRWVQERRAFWPNFDESDYCLGTFALLPADEPGEISWIRKLMGDFSCGTLLYRPQWDPGGQHLSYVRRLFPEAHIWAWEDAPNLPPGVEAVGPGRGIGDFVPEPDDPRAALD